MDLIDYINPFSESADSITQISVLSIYGVAIFSIIYLLYKYYKFYVFFKQDANTIADSEKLKELIFKFKSGLIELNGVKKSFTSFQVKVNKPALLNLFFNDKVLNSISNILVGFGILGTFLGLSKGVSGFIMDNTDTIKDSIGSLLGGMGTAFISSIWGMLSSLIFIFIYQVIRHAVAKITDKFYALMDQEFLITELEHELYQEKQLKQTLSEVVKEYFVQDEDGIERGPKYYYRELLLNSKNQTSSLSNFADDLASVLEDMLDKLLEINSEKFKEIIEDKLMPILEQLRQEKEESASGALEGVLNSLKDAMKDMLIDFKDSISGETKGEMASLADSLSKVTDALGNMPGDIQGLSQDLTGNMNELSNSINDVVKGIYKEQERSEEIRKESQDLANEKLKRILDSVGDNVGSLMDQQELSSNKLSEILNTVDGVISKNNQSIDSFRQLLTNSKEAFDNIQYSSKALTEASAGLVEGAKSIESNNKTVEAAVQTFITANNENIDKIRLLQSEVNSKTEEFLNQFSKLEGGIDNVFEKFNDGLNGYSKNLNDALSRAIGNFVDSSVKASDALGGLSRELNESVSVLTEVMSKNK
jgi:hypothetical protein